MQPTFVRVLARLECRANDPYAIVGRTVRLYDTDPLSDDFLSSSTVEQDGTAAFLFDLSLCQSPDSLFETKPDLYCVVAADDGRIIYRSSIPREARMAGRAASRAGQSAAWMPRRTKKPARARMAGRA